jgi:hypothetical protein
LAIAFGLEIFVLTAFYRKRQQSRRYNSLAYSGRMANKNFAQAGQPPKFALDERRATPACKLPVQTGTTGFFTIVKKAHPS